MNSIDKDLADIRRLTRIALPDSHTYLYRLGAVYGFASVSSFMAEVICYMDPRQNLICSFTPCRQSPRRPLRGSRCPVWVIRLARLVQRNRPNYTALPLRP